MSISKFSGLILAGGKSSRMGTNKSHLRFQNKTFLDTAFHALKDAGIERVFVSGNYPHYTCIQDAWPNMGPAAAILSAACHHHFINSECMIVIPVDMPLLSYEFLILLMHTLGEGSFDACYIENNPLPCCIKTEALKKIMPTYQDQPDISMKKLLTEHLNCKIIHSDNVSQRFFVNINTPEELSKLGMEYET